MKLEKAIKELTIPDDVILINVTPEFQKALKLGKEALKRLELGRTGVQQFAHSLLPGETE